MAGTMVGDGEQPFDDSFVEGATVKEPDWKERNKALRKRRRRERARRGATMGVYRLLQIGVIALIALAVAGRLGAGPFSWLHPADRASKSASTSSASAMTHQRGVTTTTELELELRSYRRGDCVLWDQRPTSGRRQTSVVSCTRPHLVEIDSSIDVGGQFAHYPSSQEWDAVFDRNCARAVGDLLGAPLDPAGRFVSSGIHPLRDAWSVGDRTVWCGVASATSHPLPSSQLELFTGEAQHASQTRLSPIGSCWRPNDSSAVSCTRSHEWEVTGYADLTGKALAVPAASDTAAWDRLVGDQCRAALRSYLGHWPTGGVSAGWIAIEPASWAAGRRIVECTGAHWQGTIPVSSQRPLKG